MKTTSNAYSIKRVTPKADPFLPALPTQVQPGLRFLLSEEAREEAMTLYRLLREDMWLRKGWLEGYMTRRMPQQCPNMMKADEVLGGLVTTALRHVAAHPTIPAWWLSVAVGVGNGHPELLRGSCERILQWRPAGAVEHLEEEGRDKLWHEDIVVKQTVAGAIGRGRWASDWDHTDDEAAKADQAGDASHGPG